LLVCAVTFPNQVPNDARDRRLTQPGQLGRFGTRNLIIVEANRLQNIKPIDVANDGWTSRGHCKNENNSFSYLKSPGFDKFVPYLTTDN
jgi:hypothetical protein